MRWFRSHELEKIAQRSSSTSVPVIKKILYQLYKPRPNDCVTVDIHIGGGRKFRFWPSFTKYSVNVCYPSHHFYRTNVQETAAKRALWRPNWNENLTFLIEKSKSDVLHCDFEFQLKEITYFGREHIIDTKTCTLGEIIENRKVIFKDKKEVSVGVIENDIVKCIPDIRIRDQNTLCEEEQIFYNTRRNIVNESGVYNAIWNDVQMRNQHKTKKELEYVPNIAVIGSGGGMRAVVGMCGAMSSLEKSKILDLAMYTAGVSGSSWYISTLYTKYQQTLRPSDFRKYIQHSLANAESMPDAFMEAAVKTVFNHHWYGGKYPTLTNIYGKIIGNILLEKKTDVKWSSQTTRLEKGEVPLPLLAMLHVYDDENPEELNGWVECSPYEVFMSKYGTGIDMKHFGSEFDGGFVKTKNPEQPLHVLQGICGSAYIDVLSPRPSKTDSDSWKNSWNSAMETIEDNAVAKIHNWLYGVSDIMKMFKEKDITRKDVSKDDVNSMKKVFTDISRTDISEDDISSMKKVIEVISKTDFSAEDIKRRVKVIKGISEDEINSMAKVITDISREDITENDINSMNKVFKEISEGDINSLKMVIKDIAEYNFNSMKTVIDDKKETLMLTDAGIAFNSPYPMVLHPARKIDLILSFEFSAPDYSELSEWPFSELRKAQTWAECRNIPFPDLSMIDTYKKDAIKDLYVFQGQNSPTIMHFVLYKEKENETRTECESKVLKLFQNYGTLKFNYSKDEFYWLSKLMEDIVDKHITKIKHQIREVIESKVHRESHVKT